MKQIYNFEEQQEIQRLLYNIHLDTVNNESHFLESVYYLLDKKESKKERDINIEIENILRPEGTHMHGVPFKIKTDSKLIPKNATEFIKSEFFNWKDTSTEVAAFAPQYINPNKFNWKESSWAVIKYCPEKLDIKKASLDNIIYYYPQYKNMTLKETKAQAIINKI